MSNKTRITLMVACLFTYLGVASAQDLPIKLPIQLPGAAAPAKDATAPSPELVSSLTKKLAITPEQAIGGSGALFGLAKTRLKPEEFLKVSDAVPGMDGLLKAAPKPKGEDPLGALSGMLPGNVAGLASVASSFKSLGLSPSMAVKFVPIMTKFVDLKGGASAAKILSGALK